MAGFVAGGNDTATTALQNLVIAFNSVNKTLQYINGQFTSNTYYGADSPTTRIFHGRGRVVSVTIVTKGGELSIYDSSEPTVLPASSLKFKLDSDAIIGVHPVGIEFTNGIVLSVSGTTDANVTYSVY